MLMHRRRFLEVSAGLWATPSFLAVAGPAQARTPAQAQTPSQARTPAQAQTPAPGSAPAQAPVPAGAMYPEYPAHDPALARGMVGASHGNLARVQEILAVSGTYGRAAWDWGFGDWETALGAASHVGNREIAALLMQHGARPDLFTMAMLGYIDAIRAAVAASPGIQRIRGPHGLTLLHHARKGGEAAGAVVTYLEGLGDADVAYTNLPLDDAPKAACVGVYEFGSAPEDRFDVSLNKDGALGIKRLPNGGFRNLFHHGNLAFHPPGNDVVRVTFEAVEGAMVALTVREGALVLAARRATS